MVGPLRAQLTDGDRVLGPGEEDKAEVWRRLRAPPHQERLPGNWVDLTEEVREKPEKLSWPARQFTMWFTRGEDVQWSLETYGGLAPGASADKMNATDALVP